MPRQERVLILSDGGLASLVACCAAAQDPGGAEICPASWELDRFVLRADAISRQAELCGLAISPVTLPPTPAEPVGPASTSSMLLEAALRAASAGFATVLWPVHAGPGADPDLDVVARAIDRALLVSRLAAVDAGAHGIPGIRVHTPYADFTDRQIADLAIDLDAPVQACWWWGGQDRAADAQRKRWAPILQSFGWVPA